MEESGYESSTNSRPSSSTNDQKESKLEEPSSNNNNNDAGDFECNICFELAQDPIVTLCGHLFCWPCLYRWLRFHSQSHECPVCKALVQEDKLVPLYGRGKSTSDPRSRPVPGVDIPSRPPGQRPETAQPPHGGGGGLGGVGADQSYFSNLGFGLLGGFMPMATARFGNMTMSAGFGGLFPSLFSLQFNGFPHSGMYGGGAAAHGFPYNGFPQTVHGNHGHGFVPGNEFQHLHRGGGGGGAQGQDNLLKNLFLIVGAFVLVALFWS